MRVEVREVAHARAGDKGNTSSVAVIAYDRSGYEVLSEQLTEAVIARELAPFIDGADDAVTRYELPTIGALNFVIEGALAGGVTTSLRMDSHGKSLSSAVLAIELDIDEGRDVSLRTHTQS